MSRAAYYAGGQPLTIFASGESVAVTGGLYGGHHGVVVDQSPDLRPGSVWVDLDHIGRHLVPYYRLAHRN